MKNADATEYASKLFLKIKREPIPGVKKRIEHKMGELRKFLIEQNYEIESNDSELIHDVACLSEVGYSMRQDIREPLVTTIKLDNGFEYGFSLSPFKRCLFPYDVICISTEKYGDHIVFIFDIEILIGGHINGVPVEYTAERYYG
jgi:hypothetical protein